MKKLLPASFLLAVAVPLLIAASAAAKAVNVAIGKDGFSPASVTLQAGDSITWTNKDTKKHRVVCRSCPFTSPALAPGASYSFPFQAAGAYTVADPLNGNKKMRVRVKPATAAVFVTATPETVTYGLPTTIKGLTSGRKSGETVEIYAYPCLGTGAKRVATVKTIEGGAYVFRAVPSTMTTYHSSYPAKSGAVSSLTVNVNVRPAVVVKRLGNKKFSVSVAAGRSFVGRSVVIEGFVGKNKRKWVALRTVRLATQKSAAKPKGTKVSSATFTSKLPTGVQIHAVLKTLQAVPCYLGTTSPPART